MSAVEMYYIRHSTSTGGSGLSALQREAAELKLYYMKDVCSPEEFEALIDEELQRASYIPTTSSMEKKIRKIIGKPRFRLRSFLCYGRRVQDYGHE
ncbi:hypothetical protein BUE80_DR011244 [Diplocarpon rosae]|nr:hypothetical protein BUE80_DR011244 [Diplocarpon rosae]